MLQVVEEGGAGVAKTLALGKRLPFGGAAAVHVSRPPPPTLHQLFAQAAPQAESSGEIDSITDDEETNAAAADVQSRQGGSPGRQSWGTRPQDSTNRSPQKAFASLSGQFLPPVLLHLLGCAPTAPLNGSLSNPAQVAAVQAQVTAQLTAVIKRSACSRMHHCVCNQCMVLVQPSLSSQASCQA